MTFACQYSRALLVLVTAPLVTVVHAQSPARRPPVPGAPAGITAFVGVTVIPMDTERVLPQQTVLVQQGWITALGPANQVTIPAGATRIDGQGKYLIPGLGDMHVHIGGGVPHSFRSSARYNSTQAEQRLLLWLASGVTTVRNMDYRRDTASGGFMLEGTELLRLRARAAAGEILSPRIYTSGGWGPLAYVRSSQAGKFFHPEKPRGPIDSVAVYLAAYKAAGYDHLKPYQENREVFDSVVAASRRLGIRIEGHVLDNAAGVTYDEALTIHRSIEHVMGFFDNGQPNLAAIRTRAAATQRAGVWHCPTLAIQLSASNALAVKALHDAGAGLLLGSDSPTSEILHGDPNLVHRELEAFVSLAGLTPYQALTLGTRNVAVFYGTLDSTGTIGVGKRADLVLLAGNPLTNIRHTMTPAGVMLGGRWLPRAELDRRVAALVPDSTWISDTSGYWKSMDLYVLQRNLDRLMASPSPALGTRLDSLRMASKAQWRVLADSLQAMPPGTARRRRALTLFNQQLREYRALLAATEQPAFDARVRAWFETYAADERVTK